MKKTKEHIIQSAVLLLEEDTNCSLEEIALNAGVSRRTLHRYFDGKEELIVAVFEILTDKYYQGILEIINQEEPTFETLKSLFSFELEMYSSHSTVYNLYKNYNSIYKFDGKDLDKVNAIYISHFSKLRKEGLCNNKISPQWIDAYFDSIIQLGSAQIKNGIAYNTVKKTIWQLFWNGIRK